VKGAESLLYAAISKIMNTQRFGHNNFFSKKKKRPAVSQVPSNQQDVFQQRASFPQPSIPRQNQNNFGKRNVVFGSKKSGVKAKNPKFFGKKPASDKPELPPKKRPRFGGSNNKEFSAPKKQPSFGSSKRLGNPGSSSNFAKRPSFEGLANKHFAPPPKRFKRSSGFPSNAGASMASRSKIRPFGASKQNIQKQSQTTPKSFRPRNFHKEVNPAAARPVKRKQAAIDSMFHKKAPRPKPPKRPRFTDQEMSAMCEKFNENRRMKIDVQNSMSWTYPANMEVRDYQLNFSREALFENTLVCLPTGTGKTLIAAVVMYNFSKWYPGGKIIFVAPTRPLVSQQMKSCFKVLGLNQDLMTDMTGGVRPQERAERWRDKQFFFVTSQTMVNDLNKLSTFPTNEIVCMVLDEAHKATGGHDYVNVVEFMRRRNKFFRVLALTATPAQKKESLDCVVTNLGIAKLNFMSSDDPGVKKYMKERKEDIIGPLKSDEKVEALMKAIHDRIDELIDKCCTCHGKFSMPSLPVRVGPFKVFQYCKQAMEVNDWPSYYRVKLLHTWVQLRDGLDKFGSVETFYKNLVEKENDKKSRMKSNGCRIKRGNIKKLCQECLDPSYNAKLQKCIEICKDHFSNHQNSRVMIFSSIIDSVELVTTSLNMEPELKVSKFVGQSKRGQKQSEQQAVVDKFHNGEFNILVCTCIGEEGLDVGEVDLVIHYDIVKDGLRSIQRSGRTGRKRNGRIVYILGNVKDRELFRNMKAKQKQVMKLMRSKAQELESRKLKFPAMFPDFKPVLKKVTFEQKNIFVDMSRKAKRAREKMKEKRDECPFLRTELEKEMREYLKKSESRKTILSLSNQTELAARTYDPLSGDTNARTKNSKLLDELFALCNEESGKSRGNPKKKKKRRSLSQLSQFAVDKGSSNSSPLYSRPENNWDFDEFGPDNIRQDYSQPFTPPATTEEPVESRNETDNWDFDGPDDIRQDYSQPFTPPAAETEPAQPDSPPIPFEVNSQPLDPLHSSSLPLESHVSKKSTPLAPLLHKNAPLSLSSKSVAKLDEISPKFSPKLIDVTNDSSQKKRKSLNPSPPPKRRKIEKVSSSFCNTEGNEAISKAPCSLRSIGDRSSKAEELVQYLCPFPMRIERPRSRLEFADYLAELFSTRKQQKRLLKKLNEGLSNIHIETEQEVEVVVGSSENPKKSSPFEKSQEGSSHEKTPNVLPSEREPLVLNDVDLPEPMKKSQPIELDLTDSSNSQSPKQRDHSQKMSPLTQMLFSDDRLILSNEGGTRNDPIDLASSRTPSPSGKQFSKLKRRKSSSSTPAKKETLDDSDDLMNLAISPIRKPENMEKSPQIMSKKSHPSGEDVLTLVKRKSPQIMSKEPHPSGAREEPHFPKKKRKPDPPRKLTKPRFGGIPSKKPFKKPKPGSKKLKRGENMKISDMFAKKKTTTTKKKKQNCALCTAWCFEEHCENCQSILKESVEVANPVNVPRTPKEQGNKTESITNPIMDFLEDPSPSPLKLNKKKRKKIRVASTPVPVIDMTQDEPSRKIKKKKRHFTKSCFRLSQCAVSDDEDDFLESESDSGSDLHGFIEEDYAESHVNMRAFYAQNSKASPQMLFGRVNASELVHKYSHLDSSSSRNFQQPRVRKQKKRKLEEDDDVQRRRPKPKPKPKPRAYKPSPIQDLDSSFSEIQSQTPQVFQLGPQRRLTPMYQEISERTKPNVILGDRAYWVAANIREQQSNSKTLNELKSKYNVNSYVTKISKPEIDYIVGTDYGIFRRFHKNFNARTDLAKFLNQIKEAEKYFKHLFVIIQEDLRKAQWGSPKNLKQVLRKLSMIPFVTMVQTKTPVETADAIFSAMLVSSNWSGDDPGLVIPCGITEGLAKEKEQTKRLEVVKSIPGLHLGKAIALCVKHRFCIRDICEDPQVKNLKTFSEQKLLFC